MLRFRHKLRIERPTDSVDAYGGVTKVWTPLPEVYGDVNITASREEREGGGFVEKTTAVFFTRYFPGVTTDMRIIYDGRTFSVTGVLDWRERREVLEIAAEEITRG